ncbi:hypothetical protein BGZ63DRAFT_453289 [Mariannaea sp. PMI_226]|nr:hypothetical protein BGZ63DRAFT_453289 [Mariannaea sp. PMI_226]
MAGADPSVLSTIERVGSCFSLLGCCFIISTFCFSKAFHKPINRLVFYASIGNLIVTVGTLIGTTYIEHIDSAGCQMQAFMIQWLMASDALWTLAMATNVHLRFYLKYDIAALRKVEPVYLIICYGISFVPAFTFLFVRDHHGVKVYGNALLWCWIAKDWSLLRVLVFYGPVWVVILITISIYTRIGYHIAKNHRELVNLSRQDVEIATNTSTRINTDIAIPAEAMKKDTSKMLARSFPWEHRGSGSSSGTSQASSPIYPDGVLTGEGNRSSISVPSRPVMSRAEWQYAKCALLFFTAMCITWIPSSANRIYMLTHTDGAAPALEYLSAAVLPLQGFWNAMIYMVTSWAACKVVFAQVTRCG